MTSKDPHSLFRKRLVLVDAGLLTEEEEAAMERHAEDCLSCRETRVAYAAEPAPGVDHGGGHIPSALLARWDRIRSSVQGMERELLVRHLASCSTCRRDLEVIGYDPVLATGEERREPAQVLRIDPRLRRRAWYQGAGVGALLAAAAAAVIFRVPRDGPQSETLLWVAPGVTRGSAREITIPPGTRRLLLAVSAPEDLPPDLTVRLVVEGPGGTVLDTEIPPGLRESHTIMTLMATSSPLSPGLYSVTLSGEGLREPHQSSFRVRVSGP